MVGMEAKARKSRRGAADDPKRGLILAAARRVFEAEGLDGASLRAIAAEAGYTPAALYFHFDSKEAIYAEVLQAAVAEAVAEAGDPAARLRAAALAFFAFYAGSPRDLDLGFYLFRGGMKPQGLGRERDERLNAALEAALRPISDAARDLGASGPEADLLMVDAFAHAAGLLLLAHTGRIRMFGASAAALMEAYLEDRIRMLRDQARGG
jgi:AcrR family transcriptional regulator